VVTSDDPNAAFWKDDAIEIVVDALTDRLDNNTDNSMDPVGGHCYVNFQGRFSAWDETRMRKPAKWATAVDWRYGATVTCSVPQGRGGGGSGSPLKKRLFEDPAAGNKLRNAIV
jgi:hypothetical protein